MEYCVINKNQGDSKNIEMLLNKMLSEYSRQLYNFTKKEFDEIIDYDVLTIMSLYYSKMNFEQKGNICYSIKKKMGLSDISEHMEEMFDDIEGDIYVPMSCILIDKLGDSRLTMIIYETLFNCCKKMTVDDWNENNSYSNYLALLNAAYFNALSYKLHTRDSYKSCMKSFYGEESFDDLIESLYDKHESDLDWDKDVELDILDELINEGKKNQNYESVDMEDMSDAVTYIESVYEEHYGIEEVESDKEGFELIVQKTGIKEYKCEKITGFECHFCTARSSSDEYIIVYQDESRISQIIDEAEVWNKFQHDLYYADIRNGKSTGMVYIVYILDDDSNNIPIQVIESNKTYGRKYVFTEEETITFINGIVKTSNEEINAASPVQEWDRILREEHLTGCLTETYSAKKVENYLRGERFDASYVMDDDYGMMTQSKVPNVKWVKSLDTTGFRDFCFDETSMDFGQINLFFGANGSGKTSVLEAIEYSLTSEVRRVKDFKVKMPTGSYPRLQVYDKEAGVHTFYPDFSKRNNKEIERVWYGVPAGRTKSNLNENFNRFNAFDSEAAYKFIHESDNSEENYASMFGNLMFGESVVDHDKKWQRFKKAFNDKYTELRTELNDAKYNASLYESILASKSDVPHADEVEKGIVALEYRDRLKLPREATERYTKLFEELTLIRKYIDALSAFQIDEKSFDDIDQEIADIKRQNLKMVKERRDKSEEISKLTEEIGKIKKQIFDRREEQEEIQERLNRVNTDIKNWSIVQNVLSNTETLKLVDTLLDELTTLDRELYFISKIEQRTAIVKFLKLDSYEALSVAERREKEEQLLELKNKKQQSENRYESLKKSFGEKEQQAIELRKIGKTLLTDAKCPLCGHEYDTTQQLMDIIDNSVVVDDNMEQIIVEIQKLTKQIIEIESELDREKLIEKALAELEELEDTVPMVEACGDDYAELYDYLMSRNQKEKRKNEIIEQQAALDRQGFSLNNIKACREYKSTDSSYLRFKESGSGTYDLYLANQLEKLQKDIALIESTIGRSERQIQQNEQKEELLNNDIHRLEVMLDNLDIDSAREMEQCVENIKSKFTLGKETKVKYWINTYHGVFDKCELEVERMQSMDSIEFEKKMLQEYKSTIKCVEPMVTRCARAVQTFEKIPSLSTFVEKGIRNNIQQISKFFKWMHHSGEFVELGIDEDGIYAIRGLNNERITTYQMSTGQRSTIAMAVMFSLHMAAPDAPQFLLLDEPLATMDDTQVLNVLDILKSMAEQGTQIFFTTANGIMINLFKECFKNTDFDYKEYQFVKRVNRPSEILESSINDTKTIEELSLDDLTLDFSQFAQIRDILRRNQEKLVPKEDWEEEPETRLTNVETQDVDNFYKLLTLDEGTLLNILVLHSDYNAKMLTEILKSYPNYRQMFEKINEKAVDFFGETVVENDDELPWMDEDYIEALKMQYENYKIEK